MRCWTAATPLSSLLGNEEFQNAMKDYFDGNADYDTALNKFYDAITTKYPALSY